MMRQYELVERVTAYDPDADEALLNRAYVYAMRAHGQQTRASGAPYFSHPLEVAAILTEHKLDDATIAAALLHDTIEDTVATRSEIDTMFGDEIGELVDGLTKIARLDLVSREAAQAENLRKLLLAVSNDIRVLMVKLADRLHNMRTLEHVTPAKARRIAQETMDIYAPLAGRMGMQDMRDELEDLSFKYLNPEARETIEARLAVLREESGDIIKEIETALTEKFAENGIEAQVGGREKKPYSIWRKMERKSISLGQLSDIYGFRVIVETIDQCYQVLGIMHRTWRMVPGRFKDYISTPKQNDYRSIHTTVIGPHNKRIELQIRTGQMDQVADRGVAAHALYKDANGADGPDDALAAKSTNVYHWLRRLVDMIQEGDNPRELLEHTKLELFHDQVFCFTPVGHLISLPRGATPIDFAYAVHTDVGNSCVGCAINGQRQPLSSELHNGDEVEVITQEGHTPPASWEAIAVTGKARSAIRRAAREAMWTQYGALGGKILARAVERSGAAADDDAIEEAAKRLGYAKSEDLLAAIGRHQQPVADAVRMIAGPDAAAGAQPAAVPEPERRWYSLGKVMRFAKLGGAREPGRPIPIHGLKGDLPVKFAAETGVVPGEPIVGIMTPDEGVTIYPAHARALARFRDQPERWLDLAWDIDDARDDRFPARLMVSLANDVGTLAEVTRIIGENDGNIANLSMTARAHDFFTLHIDVEVRDIDHLKEIMSRLKRSPVVSSVERLNELLPPDAPPDAVDGLEARGEVSAAPAGKQAGRGTDKANGAGGKHAAATAKEGST